MYNIKNLIEDAGYCFEYGKKLFDRALPTEKVWQRNIAYAAIVLPVACLVIWFLKKSQFFVSKPSSSSTTNIAQKKISLITKEKTAAERLEVPSCRPQTGLTTTADKGIVLYWPNNLSLLGLDENQKNMVDQAVRGVVYIGGSIGKKQITITDKQQGISRVIDLPINFTVSVVNNKPQFILLSKKLFIQGGERKIRWAFNLMTGEFRIKKRIVGAFERGIIGLMSENRIKRNLHHPIIYLDVQSTRQKPEKNLMIESLRDGDVSILFGSRPFADFSLRCAIVYDLLTDLNSIHVIRLTNYHIPEFPDGFTLYPYQAYHADIKIQNTLVFQRDNKWRGEFCDIGGASGNPTSSCISTGFSSPEYIKFFNKQRPLGIVVSGNSNKLKTISFNVKFGIKKDVWAMGLLALAILTESKETVEWVDGYGQENRTYIAPLKCLKDCIGVDKTSYYDEIGILKLTQEVLDEELNAIEADLCLKHLDKTSRVHEYFSGLKKMLRIDPNERSSIEDILSSLT